MNTSTPSRLSDAPIEDQILDCFPSGNYAMTALLRLLDIVVTDKVPSAAVECVAEPRMLINPDFVTTHAATPEKLLMLVLHELHHVLLGHTTFFRNATPIDNLVFDAIINAMLCHSFPEREYTSFFTDLYRDDSFPECLLRPPRGWEPGMSPIGDVDDGPPVVPLPGALEHPKRARVRSAYRELYSEHGSTYIELYEALAKHVRVTTVREVMLVGDHRVPDGSACGGLHARSPGLFDIVRQIVEKWPQPPQPIGGRSLSEILDQYRLSVRPDRSNRRELRRLFHQVGTRRSGDGGRRRFESQPVNIATPIPTFDRRSVVLRSLGAPPLLHRGIVDDSRRVIAGERLHVYLDVSGSMDFLLQEVYGAILDSRDFVHSRVHLFSTEVVDISLQQLRQGECHTTKGTEIACVAKHIRDNNIEKAVIITDGYVGTPTGVDRRTLKQTRLGIALVHGFCTKADLHDVVDAWAELRLD